MVGATGEPIASIGHLAASGDDRIELVIVCVDAEVVRRAGVLAVGLVDALLQEAPEPLGKARDWRTELVELQAFAASRRSSLTEAGILAAAAERDIPVIRFDRWPLVPDENNVTPVQRGLLQLGQGVHGKRLVGTATGAVLSGSYPQLRDREHLYRVLRQSGVTLPERDPEFSHLNSARRAVRSAQRIGYPVVLKPRTGPSGVGVAVNLASDDALVAAYQAASPGDRHVVVERHIEGEDYRLLIIGGEVVGACQKPSLHRAGHRSAVDPATLSAELKTMALRAAGCFGLDVAGVDLITPDPRLPLAAAGGAVIGVDPAPDLGLHCSGGEAIPLRAARRFLSLCFPRAHQPGTHRGDHRHRRQDDHLADGGAHAPGGGLLGGSCLF